MKLCRTTHGYKYQPTDLCRHFWSVIGGVAKVLLITAIVSGWLFSMGFLIYRIVQNPWIILIILGGVVGGLIIIKVITSVNWKHVPKPEKPKREKAPSLLGSWIKAKKGRFCPLIEVRE